ncbi:MAG: hydroxyphenylacetyl-CoA thioesterase PaaI [Flavobacteriales bacterium]|nr:hydroxyphenylacetyl-CoA thioesterase PaaI [Flavobacteriales bacterium]
MLSPSEITDKMMDKDLFSQWLGIERVMDGEGVSALKMTVREEMVNGFGVAHGGITFSFADSAFAFASNSRGRHAMSIETTISHHAAVHAGDILTAVAEEVHHNHKLGVYNVEVQNQKGELVASFKGTVYRKSTEW